MSQNLSRQETSLFSVLTPRERDVISYIMRGEPNKRIAASLGVSQRTVEAHRARIFRKLEVRNALQLGHRVLMQTQPDYLR